MSKQQNNEGELIYHRLGNVCVTKISCKNEHVKNVQTQEVDKNLLTPVEHYRRVQY